MPSGRHRHKQTRHNQWLLAHHQETTQPVVSATNRPNTCHLKAAKFATRLALGKRPWGWCSSQGPGHRRPFQGFSHALVWGRALTECTSVSTRAQFTRCVCMRAAAPMSLSALVLGSTPTWPMPSAVVWAFLQVSIKARLALQFEPCDA